MALYIVKRLLGAIPTLFLVIVLSFMLVHAAPCGPFDEERVLPPEIEKNLLAYYHLDEPLPQQFLRYISNLMRGDFGPSYRIRDRDVDELIGEALPYSVMLGSMAIVIALFVGVATGTYAALRRNTYEVEKFAIVSSIT